MKYIYHCCHTNGVIYNGALGLHAENPITFELKLVLYIYLKNSLIMHEQNSKEIHF